MVGTVCLRLALGMIVPMLVLPIAIVPPRFFRVQFLSGLALIILAGLFLAEPDVFHLAILALCGLTCAMGAIVWHTDEAPLGRSLMFISVFLTAGALIGRSMDFPNSMPWLALDDLASALMLGSAVSAMLMGHSYLIAPAMSLAPLNRLLGLLALALGIRSALACAGLYWWTRQSSGATLDLETGLWLGSRWLLGLIIPVGLTWMAWETARIRSTQSATGILYVVTIVVFLGELLSMLLIDKMGLIM
jgi:hypothetical protein